MKRTGTYQRRNWSVMSTTGVVSARKSVPESDPNEDARIAIACVSPRLVTPRCHDPMWMDARTPGVCGPRNSIAIGTTPVRMKPLGSHRKPQKSRRPIPARRRSTAVTMVTTTAVTARDRNHTHRATAPAAKRIFSAAGAERNLFPYAIASIGKGFILVVLPGRQPHKVRRACVSPTPSGPRDSQRRSRPSQSRPPAWR